MIFFLTRFCSFEGANENVWHVLDVQPNSPAQQAGLRTDSDYIIGADSVLHEVRRPGSHGQFKQFYGQFKYILMWSIESCCGRILKSLISMPGKYVYYCGKSQGVEGNIVLLHKALQ